MILEVNHFYFDTVVDKRVCKHCMKIPLALLAFSPVTLAQRPFQIFPPIFGAAGVKPAILTRDPNAPF